LPEHPSSYLQLVREAREISLLGSAMSVLGWDEQTYMPAGAASLRADQVSLLARMAHERHTGAKFADMLAAAEADLPPNGAASVEQPDAAVNLHHLRRDFDRAAKLPAEFVEEMSRTSVMSEQAWTHARRSNDFAAFQPWLEKMLSLKQREVEYLGGTGELYDTLLEDYEPGMTSARLRDIFSELRTELVQITAGIRESGRRAPVDIARRRFPLEGQESLARRAAAAFGFDFSQGRLDISAHPFCSFIGPGDTRMTTRYDEMDISNSFFSVLHETGHGLYDQGLPEEHFGTPLGEYVSLGIHESQSRLWENLVGRGEAFWQWMWPIFQKEFAEPLAGVHLRDWMFAINNVEPSLIRTESDEVTYNLHILLRFELEQRLLGGDLPAKDLPGEWNSAMSEMLGICPTSDAEGCLQDIHWSGGGIGYVPTYTLGNLISAQLFEAAKSQTPGLEDEFAQGDFSHLLEWLRANVHRHGKRYSAEELVQRATGKPLSAEALLNHLRAKAAKYYGV
jgi:carboxypeptidase Taq